MQHHDCNVGGCNAHLVVLCSDETLIRIVRMLIGDLMLPYMHLVTAAMPAYPQHISEHFLIFSCPFHVAISVSIMPYLLSVFSSLIAITIDFPRFP